MSTSSATRVKELPSKEQPYISEGHRAISHSPTIIGIARTSKMPRAALPPSSPYLYHPCPSTKPRVFVGWLEFHSSNPPDPEFARPGDVWIQLGQGGENNRVFVCYAPEGRSWTEWEGNRAVQIEKSPAYFHPFLSTNGMSSKRVTDHFYLIFTGTAFLWADYNRMNASFTSWKMGKMPGAWSMTELFQRHSPGDIPLADPHYNVLTFQRIIAKETTQTTNQAVQVKKRTAVEADSTTAATQGSTKRRRTMDKQLGAVFTLAGSPLTKAEMKPPSADRGRIGADTILSNNESTHEPPDEGPEPSCSHQNSLSESAMAPPLHDRPSPTHKEFPLRHLDRWTGCSLYDSDSEPEPLVPTQKSPSPARDNVPSDPDPVSRTAGVSSDESPVADCDMMPQEDSLAEEDLEAWRDRVAATSSQSAVDMRGPLDQSNKHSGATSYPSPLASTASSRHPAASPPMIGLSSPSIFCEDTVQDRPRVPSAGEGSSRSLTHESLPSSTRRNSGLPTPTSAHTFTFDPEVQNARRSDRLSLKNSPDSRLPCEQCKATTARCVVLPGRKGCVNCSFTGRECSKLDLPAPARQPLKIRIPVPQTRTRQSTVEQELTGSPPEPMVGERKADGDLKADSGLEANDLAYPPCSEQDLDPTRPPASAVTEPTPRLELTQSAQQSEPPTSTNAAETVVPERTNAAESVVPERTNSVENANSARNGGPSSALNSSTSTPYSDDADVSAMFLALAVDALDSALKVEKRNNPPESTSQDGDSIGNVQFTIASLTMARQVVNGILDAKKKRNK
ncbi:hypothetical protein BV25DRAFT_1294904 [Artomyces pyxidatus]|uniref:Uncharacterized protein n=1 Tax=Artomyces pyxidatus TaxID=48021 RepID=A0ACB8SPH2_9AGAM|nr:hypothetical protein BV25DRAFT_1294904 [Artomyces pyxidatus]